MTESEASTVCRVDIEETGKIASVPSGTLIIDVLRSVGIEIHADCGGKGNCGQCRVVVSGEKHPQAGTAELKLLAPSERNRGVRLACCTAVTNDMTLRLTEKTTSGDVRLQMDGLKIKMVVDPAIQPVQITLPQTDQKDVTFELDQISQALEQGQGINALLPSNLIADLKSHQQNTDTRSCSVLLRGREVVAVLEASAKPVALAVDLGTTKVAGYLLDLATGETLASCGILNPQSRFGADIMTRLQHAVTDSGRKQLVQEVRRGINTLLHQLADAAQIPPFQIVDACIVANTAMVHLLLDLPVGQLARAPYTPSSVESFDIKAKEMELNIAPEAYVHIPPAIGGFVGADHVALIMAADIDQMDQVAVALDIGTNTEIVLKCPESDRLYCLSCPSGPAFEGAHVSNGMHAAAGAIEEIRITDSLAPTYATIDNAPAIGLCGSAMIDAVSELYRCGLIDERGRFQEQIRSEGNRYLIVPPSESGTGNAIWLSQKDIDEILLAKGAIRAGIDVLLQASQIQPDDVKHVFIAGAFGTYINLTNAIQIGLLPDFSSAEYHQIGNAAAVGAKIVLLDRTARQRAERIASDAHHVELIRQPGFNRHFAQGMMLPKAQPQL